MTICTLDPVASGLSTVVELLSLRAEQQPGQRAYSFLNDGDSDEEHITYGKLHQRAQAIAAHLQAINAEGERVLLLYPPGLDYIAAFFGCLYSGAIAVPAYPPRINRPLPRLQSIVADSKAAIALTNDQILSDLERRLPNHPDLAALRWISTEGMGIQDSGAWRAPHISGDSLAFLQYTSGSTAEPKGVMVGHRNLLENLRVIRDQFGTSAQSVAMVWLPPYHDMGLIGGILQPLFTGFPSILMPPMSFLQKPFLWLQAISRFGANFSGGPNFAYDLCTRKITAEQKLSLELSCWDLAFNGAEPVHPETMERFAAAFEPCGFYREAFYPCYGLAECTLFVTGGPRLGLPVIQAYNDQELTKGRAVPEDMESENARRLVGCGSASGDCKVYIVDPESGQEVGPGGIGEIWVAGGSLARGYWNRPEVSEQVFGASLPGRVDGPLLRTGDLGFVEEDDLFVTGRLKDLIIVRGRNYYPTDLERTVEASHIALRPGCCAVFTAQIANEERLVVCQELERQHRNADGEEIAGAIRRAVAEDHELHVHTVLLLKTGSIAKTSSGKIQRHQCRIGYLNNSLDLIYASTPASGQIPGEEEEARPEATPTGLLADLKEQIAHLLGISAAGINPATPINSLGLDSLMAVELKGYLESTYSLEFPMERFVQEITLADLAAELAAQLPASEPAPAAASGVSDSAPAHPESAVAPEAPPHESLTVPTLFAVAAGRYEDRIAVVDGARTWTFGQLADAVGRLSGWLRSQDVRIGDPVRLYNSPRAETLIGALAVMAAGAVVALVGPETGEDSSLILAPGTAIQSSLPPALSAAVFIDNILASPSADGGEAAPLDAGREASCIVTGGFFSPDMNILSHGDCLDYFNRLSSEWESPSASSLLSGFHAMDTVQLLETIWTLTRGSRVVFAEPLRASAPQVRTARNEMDFSLLYFSSNEGIVGSGKYDLFLDGSRYADRNGFLAVWTPERHFHAFGGLYPNPSVLSSALAMITSRIRIRSGSVVIPMHNPVRVAEEWAVVDNLSAGRVDLGFAQGWNPNDFVLAPGNYPGRKELLFESVRTVQKLWRGESITLPNGVGKDNTIRIYPLPVQRELNVWITCTNSPERFVEAGHFGANVLTALLFQSAEDLAAKIKIYRKSREEAGFDPATGKVTLMLHTFLADDLASVRKTVRAPFIEYLKSSVDLWQTQSTNLQDLGEKEREDLLNYAFERYYQTAAMMGTPESCARTVEQFKASGIDEIASLIDFGVETREAIQGLDSLNRLRERFANDSGGDVPHGAREPGFAPSFLQEHGIRFAHLTPELTAELSGVDLMGLAPSLRILLVNDDNASALDNTPETAMLSVVTEGVRQAWLMKEEGLSRTAEGGHGPAVEPVGGALPSVADGTIRPLTAHDRGAESTANGHVAGGKPHQAPEMAPASSPAAMDSAGPSAPEARPNPSGKHEETASSIDMEARHRLAYKPFTSVLQRAYEFDVADQLRASGLMPYFRELTRNEGATCIFEGRSVVMLGSNNYLGLTADMRVREATAKAALEEGPSLTGSRLLNGSTTMHRDFEHKLAEFLGHEDGLVFTTGYQANIGLISALMTEGTTLLLDNQCHASIFDGAGVGRCRVLQYRHNDMGDLERRLQRVASTSPTMVMIDGVYSMGGDIAPLPQIVELCRRYGSAVTVDDAHGLGMIGAGGRGTEEHYGMIGESDLLVGTFSKSLASIGGWVVGKAKVVDWIRFNGRSMLFSAAIPPTSLVAASTALDILILEPWRVQKLNENAGYWHNGLRALGFRTGESGTPIVPVEIGDDLLCMQFGKALLDNDVYVNPVVAPAVARGSAMLRTSVMATHEHSHLDQALEVFGRVGQEMGII